MIVQSISLADLRDMFTQWAMKWSLVSLLLVAFATHFIYHAIMRYLERRVGGVSTSHQG
jgi:hypothetical protein